MPLIWCPQPTHMDQDYLFATTCGTQAKEAISLKMYLERQNHQHLFL